MAYVGTPIDTRNQFQSLQGKRFNGDGSTTDFTLDVAPSSTLDIEVFVGNVRQDPNSAYTLSGTTLSFTGAPPSGTNNIYVVHQAKAVGTITPPDSSITSDKLSGNLVTPGTFDVNGQELILDADADTSITADTDDQIDIKIAGADDFQFTANTFTAQSGSTITTPTLGVGLAKDLGVGLHIKTADCGGGTPGGGRDNLIIEDSGSTGMTIIGGASNDIGIAFGDSGNASIGLINYNNTDNHLTFQTNDSVRMKIAADGDVLIAKTSVNSATVGHQLHAIGEVAHTRAAQNVAIFNREDNGSGQNFDGQLISFRANNTEQGTINISGSTTSYNAFSGAHWGRLADNTAPTILRGTVIETISTMIDWYTVKMTNADGYEFHEEIVLPDGKSVGDTISHTAEDGVTYNGVIEKQINEQLPMTKISDTEDSKAVYGVFNSWDNEPDDGINDMLVTALGAFIVRIHKDETVAIGDLLSSKGDGTAKKQADDIFRASTIAKVTSTEKTHTYDDGSYCVPCTLHCG